MKNTLIDIQNHLVEMLETLNDNSLEGDKLDTHIRRCLTAVELTKVTVANGALMVKALDTLYGIDVNFEADMKDLPLIPSKKKGETANCISADKKMLIAFPNRKGKKRDDEEWADQM